MEIGSDPCNRNKKLQTPYAAANDKETRNIFRRFMGANPDKFNYSKVFIIYFFLFIKIIFIYHYYKLIHISIIKSQIPGPLTDEIEHEESEKKRQQRKIKREKDKLKRKEFELKKQEEDAKQRYLCLSDREKVYILKNNYEIYKYCIDKLNGMNFYYREHWLQNNAF